MWISTLSVHLLTSLSCVLSAVLRALLLIAVLHTFEFVLRFASQDFPSLELSSALNSAPVL